MMEDPSSLPGFFYDRDGGSCGSDFQGARLENGFYLKAVDLRGAVSPDEVSLILPVGNTTGKQAHLEYHCPASGHYIDKSVHP